MPADKPSPVCTWVGPKVDKYISGSSIDTLHYTTRDVCQVACEIDPDCHSINWKVDLKECDLNDVLKPEGDLDSRPHTEYYVKSCNPGNVTCTFISHTLLVLQGILSGL